MSSVDPATRHSYAGKTRLAGIEPARDDAQNVGISSDFSAQIELCGAGLVVRRDGKHLNLHLFGADGAWTFEEAETAIPKLEALLSAAKLAQEGT